jgi:hypothetical protein
MKDLIIGCFFGYDWGTVQYWANSIDICGFRGDRAVMVYDTDRYTLDRLRALRFSVYPFDPVGVSSGFAYPFPLQDNYARRFQVYYEYLSNLTNFDEYRYVIATDVRDVVFQSDPSVWLQANIGDKQICASCESLSYRDEWWGNARLRQCYPRLYGRMASRPIWNCGVQAGDIGVMKDFWLQLAMTCAAGLEAAEQVAYNILLSLRPWCDITRFTMSEDGWACQAATTAIAASASTEEMARRKPLLLQPDPVWDGTFTCTNAGKPHVVLHQYNWVPQWREAVQRRYYTRG